MAGELQLVGIETVNRNGIAECKYKNELYE